MRGVQPRVFRIDRDKHLNDVVFRQAIENDRRDRELLVLHVLDVGVQRQQPMLSVNGPKNPSCSGTLKRPTDDPASIASKVSFSSHEMITAPAMDGRSRLTALLVVLDEFVNLSPDDLPLIGLLA